MDKRNTKYYSKRVSEKLGIKEKDVHKVLSFFMQNMIKTIKNGHDIRLEHFGHIYVDKKALITYFIKKNARKNTK